MADISNLILVLGHPGSGKTCSLMNLDPDETIIIRAWKKPLPFKNNFKPFTVENKKGTLIDTADPDKIVKIIKNAKNLGKKVVVIDDFNLIMSQEFMEKAYVKGFDKFTEIGRHMWDIIKAAQESENDIRFYFLAHIQKDESGVEKMKTIGKMLDEKGSIDGLFYIILKAVSDNDQHFFATRTDGSDVVRTPIGMFEDNLIPNDLKLVDDKIKEYNNIA